MATQLRIRQAQPGDVPEIVRIHFAAFETGPMNALLYPDGVTDEIRTSFGKMFFPDQPPPVLQAGEHVNMIAELVWCDSAGNLKEGSTKIIAYARWAIFNTRRTEEQWQFEQPPATAETRGNGVDYEFYEAFLGGLQRMRRSWMKGDRCMGEHYPSFMTARPCAFR
jgi:hypothetical protein